MLNFKTLSIMKTRLLKITLSFAMLFIAAGAFAQNLGDPFGSDYNLSSFTTGEDSAIVGTQIPYYIDPDPVINNLSGNYDTTSLNANQGIFTSFNWSVTGGSHAAGDFTLNYPAPSDDTSAYVVVTMPTSPTAGGDADTLEVYEYNPSAASCPGPTRQVPIRIFDEPSFDVSANDQVDTIEVCDGSNITLTLNNVADNGINKGGNVKFLMDTSVTTVNAGDYSTDVSTVNTATDIVISRLESAALTDGNYNFFTRTLTAVDGHGDASPDITKYTYTFKGMNDHISRKSDFYHIPDLTNVNDTDFTFYGPSGNDDAVVYVVFPTPQTGEIYYVPNDYDL